LFKSLPKIVATYTNLEKNLSAKFLRQTGYATPKIDVRGAVIRDGKILLVQERMDKQWACWRLGEWGSAIRDG